MKSERILKLTMTDGVGAYKVAHYLKKLFPEEKEQIDAFHQECIECAREEYDEYVRPKYIKIESLKQHTDLIYQNDYLFRFIRDFKNDSLTFLLNEKYICRVVGRDYLDRLTEEIVKCQNIKQYLLKLRNVKPFQYLKENSNELSIMGCGALCNFEPKLFQFYTPDFQLKKNGKEKLEKSIEWLENRIKNLKKRRNHIKRQHCSVLIRHDEYSPFAVHENQEKDWKKVYVDEEKGYIYYDVVVNEPFYTNDEVKSAAFIKNNIYFNEFIHTIADHVIYMDQFPKVKLSYFNKINNCPKYDFQIIKNDIIDVKNTIDQILIRHNKPFKKDLINNFNYFIKSKPTYKTINDLNLPLFEGQEDFLKEFDRSYKDFWEKYKRFNKIFGKEIKERQEQINEEVEKKTKELNNLFKKTLNELIYFKSDYFNLYKVNQLIEKIIQLENDLKLLEEETYKNTHQFNLNCLDFHNLLEEEKKENHK